MADRPIEKFWEKLMVASRSINKIPEHYLKLAMNARIFDGWIGPRRWKILHTNSSLWTVNQGGFLLNGVLYQVANSRIYRIDDNGTQTEVVNLWFDQRIDVLVYQFPRGDFTVGQTLSHNYTVPDGTAGKRFTNIGNDNVLLSYFDEWEYKNFDQFQWSGTTTGRPIPAIKILTTGTSWAITPWDGGGTVVSDGILIERWQYVENASVWTTGSVNVEFGYFEAQEQAILVSDNNTINVFDGQSIVDTQQFDNDGIIEFTRGFSFLGQGNILRISAPVTIDNPENAYNFSGASASNIVYESNILGLHGTMNGLYVWNRDKVEFLGSNALQSVSGSATFISTPLWECGELINNQCVASIGDRIFFVTRDLQIQTINYIGGTDSPVVGELSERPIIGIKELLNDIDEEQPYAFAFQNKKDKTVQFHLRRIGSRFNDIVIVYDFINDTWDVDTWKDYNWVVEDGNRYYGFSDINTSVYIDDEWRSDAWSPIPFFLRTQDMNLGTLMQKRYTWFYTAWAIGPLSRLDYSINIDWGNVFRDSIQWEMSRVQWAWEIGFDEIWITEIGGSLTYEWDRFLFDRTADQGRIFMDGTRIQFEISSMSDIQDYLIDMLGYTYERTPNIDISNKF